MCSILSRNILEHLDSLGDPLVSMKKNEPQSAKLKSDSIKECALKNSTLGYFCCFIDLQSFPGKKQKNNGQYEIWGQSRTFDLLLNY